MLRLVQKVMSKTIFISHVFEDHKYAKKVKAWEEKGYLPGYIVTYDVEDARPDGKKVILDRLSDKLRGAAVILILVGQDTHNHPWIQREFNFGIEYNKKICCLRVPNTDGGKTSYLKKYDVPRFDPNNLLKELSK